MPLDFPNPPLTVGQTFPAPNGVTYTWDGTKWTVSGGGSSQITGPLTIGGPALSPAPLAATLTADQIVVRASSGIGSPLPGDIPANLLLNMYEDPTNVLHYVGNGAAGAVGSHNITAGITEGRLTLSVADVNTAGPGAPCVSRGAMHICYGTPGNPSPFVVLGTQAQVPAIPARAGTVIVSELVTRADPLTTGADDVSRVSLNQYFGSDNTARYIDNGPSANMSMHTGFLQISTCDVGIAGSPVSTNPTQTNVFRLRTSSGVAAAQTVLEISVNNNAGFNRVQVTLGAPDSGGTGFRTLLVPN